MAAQFKHIMLMVKDIPATVKFYSEGLGLKVIKSSPGWAELDADGTTIALHAASEDGQSGSSPILSFHVDDVYGTIATLEEMGYKKPSQICPALAAVRVVNLKFLY